MSTSVNTADSSNLASISPAAPHLGREQEAGDGFGLGITQRRHSDGFGMGITN